MLTLDKTIEQLTVPTPFAVGDTHVYLLKGDILTLVDAGVKTKEAWEALKSGLRKIGYYPNDIEQIVLTHHHPDHIGLIEQFPRAERLIADSQVDYWITRDEQYLEQYVQFFIGFFTSCGVPDRYLSFIKKLEGSLSFAGKGKLTSTLKNGDFIPGHDHWQVIETKGHAQSHLSFFREEDGTFIGGDHLLHHISSNPLLEPPSNHQESRPKPLLQYRSSLKKCLSLDIQTVLPGHGKIFSEVEKLINFRLQRQEKFARRVERLLKKERLTPFQVCRYLFPKQFAKQLDLTMSETIGQLDFLQAKGVVEQVIEDDKIFYRLHNK